MSVIIPCYNAEKWIALAIESALSQDYERVDVVVSDDGSTDASRAIAEGFGARVTCVSRPNRGPSAARNLGLSYARGNIIQFLDADDVLHTNRISAMLRAWEVFTEADFVAGRYSSVTDKSSSADFVVSPLSNLKPEIRKNALSVNYLPCAGLFRKSFLHSIGPWNETLSRWVDLEYHARIAARSRKFVYVDLPLYGYRQHDGPRISNHNKTHTSLDAALQSLSAAEASLSVDGLTEAQRDYLVPFYVHLARGYAKAGRSEAFLNVLHRASALSTRLSFRHKARAANAFARLFGARATSIVMDRMLPPLR